MTSHYRNTTSVVYLLLCLFITSASCGSSFIRQFTDDFNANLQQAEGNGVGPNPDLEEAHYLDTHEEVTSRDHKVSASSTVKGMRDRPPSSYSLKMESFNTLLKSTSIDSYESRPFSVGGYNWTLVVYPTGNKKDNGAGYLSLYVAVDKSIFVAARKEVYADLRFYIFNNNERQYFTIQDTNVWRFNAFKTMWGFSQVIPVETFKDSKNGYLYDGDHCEFGVDVTIPTTYETSELFTLYNFNSERYTYVLPGFSTLLKNDYFSDVFSMGGRWTIRVFPTGYDGKFLSMFLRLDEKQKFVPYEKMYVRAQLRVLNQLQFSNREKTLEVWFAAPGYGYSGWGYNEFIPLSDLKDLSKGFVVKDALKFQVQLDALSLTKYFPN